MRKIEQEDIIKERAINFAIYTILNKSTVRQTAKVFGICKSTVHEDITKRLFKIDRFLYEKVRYILDNHIENRSRKGGETTHKFWVMKRGFVKKPKVKAYFKFEDSGNCRDYYRDDRGNWYAVIKFNNIEEIYYCCNYKNGTPPFDKLEPNYEVGNVELIREEN